MSTPMRLSGCCARIVIGHVATPASPAMNSRRLMGLPPNRARIACHKGCHMSRAATFDAAIVKQKRTTVELAVGRQRKTIQHHKRRRYHVLGRRMPLVTD